MLSKVSGTKPLAVPLGETPEEAPAGEAAEMEEEVAEQAARQTNK